MKGALRTLSLLAAMMTPQFLRGYKTAKTSGDVVPVKPRFIAGDQFYKHMPMKRVNGKWKVKR